MATIKFRTSASGPWQELVPVEDVGYDVKVNTQSEVVVDFTSWTEGTPNQFIDCTAQVRTLRVNLDIYKMPIGSMFYISWEPLESFANIDLVNHNTSLSVSNNLYYNSDGTEYYPDHIYELHGIKTSRGLNVVLRGTPFKS